MSNYRRTSKPKTEHIKKGFTVFQKTVATIASILGLITAGITIMNALDNNKNIKKEPTTSQTTTIVKEIQKESLRKTPVQLKRLTLVKKKHSKRKHQNLASRKRKKKIRKQQLRTLLLLLQVNLLLKTKNSPMRQLQKIKAINSH
ncbi:TBC1 domain family member 8B [Streptococcus pneumoniae]|nr:TBC1 domain family member 8B [Streptococcus pneumoniae]